MASEKNSKSLLLLFLLIALASFTMGTLFGFFVLFPSSHSTDSSPEASSEFLDEPTISEEESADISHSQEESLNRYKDMLKKTLDTQTPQEPSRYGVYIDQFAQNERANDFSIDIKSQYPYWKISVYPKESFFVVAVGPFENKEEAEDFLKELPKDNKFKQARLTQIPL